MKTLHALLFLFMAYIIDNYNKYDQWDRTHSVHIFYFNDEQYAIKEVEMEWGVPKLPTRMDEVDNKIYKVYNTLDDALEFVQKIRHINS